MTELIAFGVFVVMLVNAYIVWYFQHKGNALAVGFFVIAIVLLAGNIALTIQSRADINRVLGQSCTARKTVAEVQVDTQGEAKSTNKLFLLKGFPGLTHRELAELIERKEGREDDRVKKLESVVHESCKGI